MPVSKEDVAHAAELCKLQNTSADTDVLADMFEETFSFVQILDELPASNVSPTFQVTGLSNVFQKNAVKESLSCESALKNALRVKDCLFETDGVFGDRYA